MVSPYFRQRTNVATLAVTDANSQGMIVPQDMTAAVTGNILDRLGAASGKIVLANSAEIEGSATAATASVVLQHSDSSSFATYETFATLASAEDIFTAGSRGYELALEGAKRYLRLVVTPTYTGGTTPNNYISADLILGDYDEDPQDADMTVFDGE